MMSDHNQFQKSGYNQFYKDSPAATPPHTAPQSAPKASLGAQAFQKLRSPIVATGALLLVGAAFSVLIIGSYPSGDTDKVSVPTVHASNDRFKVAPDDRGGSEIAYRDSTIFGSVSGNPMDVNAPMENLLDQDETAIGKLVAFEKEASEAMRKAEKKASMTTASAKETSLENLLEPVVKQVSAEKPVMKQSVQKVTPQEVASAAKRSAKAKQASAQNTPPKTLHTPGGSPETLAFVRSVLDQKDGASASTQEARSAARVAAIAPASGDASADIVPAGEGFFVQLGSVRSQNGAVSEWARLQKAFGSDLLNAEYRVQTANLGERGTYYRIQAGPYTKTHATSICDSIKMQSPGACLIVR